MVDSVAPPLLILLACGTYVITRMLKCHAVLRWQFFARWTVLCSHGLRVFCKSFTPSNDLLVFYGVVELIIYPIDWLTTRYDRRIT